MAGFFLLAEEEEQEAEPTASLTFDCSLPTWARISMASAGMDSSLELEESSSSSGGGGRRSNTGYL